MIENKIINSDSLEHLKTLDDNIFDSCVTDPPYELGFMGKIWDSTGIAFQKDFWKEVYRTLKPGAHLLAFSASRNYHRMAVAIEDAGFEIRDQIMWIYGSGFPKNLNLGKAIDERNGVQGKVIGTRKVTSSDIGQKSGWNHLNTDRGDYQYREIMNEYKGWGTALKPAHEPIVLARKTLSENTVIDNVIKHKTGGINIDASRIKLTENDDPRLGGNGSWSTKKSKEGVFKMGYEGKRVSSSEHGRFPANIIHDGLKEEWARFFYCPKANKKEKGDTTHPTVKPLELMKYLVRLVTPKDGIVLDPFAGTGTTGEAAMLEEFKYYLIEMTTEYIKDIENRVNKGILF